MRNNYRFSRMRKNAYAYFIQKKMLWIQLLRLLSKNYFINSNSCMIVKQYCIWNHLHINSYLPMYGYKVWDNCIKIWNAKYTKTNKVIMNI